jgi:hypothetical protein
MGRACQRICDEFLSDIELLTSARNGYPAHAEERIHGLVRIDRHESGARVSVLPHSEKLVDEPLPNLFDAGEIDLDFVEHFKLGAHPLRLRARDEYALFE